MKRLGLIMLAISVFMFSCSKEPSSIVNAVKDETTNVIEKQSSGAFCNDHGAFYNYTFQGGVVMNTCQYIYVFDSNDDHVDTWLNEPQTPGSSATVVLGIPPGPILSIHGNCTQNNIVSKKYCSLFGPAESFRVVRTGTYLPAPLITDFPASSLWGITTDDCECDY